jgi:hypothetical protein
LIPYHEERNHQGLDNQLLQPDEEVGQIAGRIQCRERLGGLLRYYLSLAAGNDTSFASRTVPDAALRGETGERFERVRLA